MASFAAFPVYELLGSVTTSVKAIKYTLVNNSNFIPRIVIKSYGKYEIKECYNKATLSAIIDNRILF